MARRIFIDGEAGTTGLEIRQRLQALSETSSLTILAIDPDRRKDAEARKAMMEQADIVVLCLPDAAAREAVALGAESGARFLDASTAHRVAEGWVYGLAELQEDQAQKIASARFVSNPGCYASGAIALLRPLVEKAVLPADYPLSINAISGYSGGGRSMIEAHSRENSPAFMLYGLGLAHKHLPEIIKYTGLSRKPVFVPSVGHFPQGMIVSIPLHLSEFPGHPSVQEIGQVLADYYHDSRIINVKPAEETLLADMLAGQDIMELRVHGAGDHAVLTARLDNLGKGASGAAVQNLLLMAGQGRV